MVSVLSSWPRISPAVLVLVGESYVLACLCVCAYCAKESPNQFDIWHIFTWLKETWASSVTEARDNCGLGQVLRHVSGHWVQYAPCLFFVKAPCVLCFAELLYSKWYLGVNQTAIRCCRFNFMDCIDLCKHPEVLNMLGSRGHTQHAWWKCLSAYMDWWKTNWNACVENIFPAAPTALNKRTHAATIQRKIHKQINHHLSNAWTGIFSEADTCQAFYTDMKQFS